VPSVAVPAVVIVTVMFSSLVLVDVAVSVIDELEFSAMEDAEADKDINGYVVGATPPPPPPQPAIDNKMNEVIVAEMNLLIIFFFLNLYIKMIHISSSF